MTTFPIEASTEGSIDGTRRTSKWEPSSRLRGLRSLFRIYGAEGDRGYPGRSEMVAGVTLAAVALRFAVGSGIGVKRLVPATVMVAVATDLTARGRAKSNVSHLEHTRQAIPFGWWASDTDHAELVDRMMPTPAARHTRPLLTAQALISLGPESQN